MAHFAHDSGIADVLERYCQELIRVKLPIAGIYLFGSYAKGTQKEQSDIDIAIFWDKDTLNRLEADVQLLKLTRNIDLRIEPHSFCREDVIDPDPFVKEILAHGKRID
jgi:predicted nucleotidyltransferase